MFSLIITIISIALVAALALATIYYGGSAFTRGGDAAKASQLINEGQQLQGARTLAAVDLAAPADLDDLSPEYLSQVPAGWQMDAVNNVFTATGGIVTAEVCAEVNKKANIITAEVELQGDKVYGCTSGNVMTYRF